MPPISALVVGIECYAQRGWDVAGPGRSAVEVVEWLLTTKAEPKNIWLFANFKKHTQFDEERVVAQLIAKNVKVNLSPDWPSIDTCISKLAEQRSPGSRLLVYWSGHGYTDTTGRRLFFCQDYTADAMRSRVFNVTNWLRQLRSSRFQAFSDQIVIGDTCAGYERLKSSPGEEIVSDQIDTIRQIAFFASPEGQVTEADDNGSEFTRIFLDAVRQNSDWPDHAEFFRRMKELLDKNNRQAFRIWGSSQTDSIPDRILGNPRGQVRAAPRSPDIYRPETELSRYPLPETNDDDNQKGRWGRKSRADGRRVDAFVVKRGKEDYLLTLRVSSTDGSRLQGPVRFHRHKTYIPKIVTVRKSAPDAEMKGHQAYETYTVGVEVLRVDGKRTVLELDLEKSFHKADRIYKRNKE